MRPSYMRLYDSLYYGTERSVKTLVMSYHNWRRMLKVDCGPAFQQAYKNTIRPYWKRYGIRIKKSWAKRNYMLTHSLDPRYVPNDVLYRRIIPYFNNIEFSRPLQDKNLHGLLFPGFKRPETVIRRVDRFFYDDDFSILSAQEALDRCSQPGSYIIKPSRDSDGGQDICFYEYPPIKDVSALLKPYENIDFIVQKTVRQHPDLAAFNPSSLNTIRVITMVWRGEPYLLSAILRIGQTGSRVDNVSKGGYQAVIRPDGTLEKLAYTRSAGNTSFVEKTDRGIVFDGFHIPCWEKVVSQVKALAIRLPHLKYVGWDLAVDEQGDVVLVEFNSGFVQNQENCGPAFGDMTDEVLGEIFQNRKGTPNEDKTTAAV